MVDNKVCFSSNELIDLSFDCIYDLEPLNFKKYSINDDNIERGFESQDLLEEINLGSGDDVRPTYICKNIDKQFRAELINLLVSIKIVLLGIFRRCLDLIIL